MLIFSWILRHGQVLGSWEWGVGSQGRAEVTGGRDSRVREAHWGAGKQASLPAAQEMCTRAPPGGGGVVFTSPPSPSSDQEAGGRPSGSQTTAPLALVNTPSAGACAASFHHSLLPSSLLSPGHFSLFSEDRPWLPSSPPRLLNSGCKRGSAVPNLFGTRDRFHGRQFFHRPRGGGWFGDDSSTLHLLCTLFLT